jgi:hypothetical protein
MNTRPPPRLITKQIHHGNSSENGKTKSSLNPVKTGPRGRTVLLPRTMPPNTGATSALNPTGRAKPIWCSPSSTLLGLMI